MEAFSGKLNACFESWLGPRGEFGSLLLLDVQTAAYLCLTAANISGL